MNRWSASTPIYQQLADLLAEGILEGTPSVGEPFPSVQQLARIHLINPLIVKRALEVLEECGWIEARERNELFVPPTASDRIAEFGRNRFLEQEWPVLLTRLRRLHIGQQDLR